MFSFTDMFVVGAGLITGLFVAVVGCAFLFVALAYLCAAAIDAWNNAVDWLDRFDG